MSPDTPDVTPEDAPESTTPAVKKPRAPRKTAVKAAPVAEAAPEAEAPVAEAALAPAAPRKRTRKAAEPVEPRPTRVAGARRRAGRQAPAVPAVLEARASRAPERAAPNAVPRCRPRTPLRRPPKPVGRRATATQMNPAAPMAPIRAKALKAAWVAMGRAKAAVRAAAAAAAAAAAVPTTRRPKAASVPRARKPPKAKRGEEGAESTEGGEPRPPRGDRPPRPERGPRVVVEFASADVSDTFAGVLSGDFDSEAELGDGESAIPAKRVLAAEPDAPKLHKVLAQSGIGSRRDMEQLITDGKVTVNGEVAHTGQRISFGDEVRVAGRVVKLRIAPPPARVIAYHKPSGEVVTMDDPENRPTVFRRLPRLQHGKWQSVGRLDINTEGLLLFTNSGDLANKLMHPRFGVEREYAVRVLGTLETESREKLLAGVSIDGQAAHFKSIEDGGGEGANRWYRVVITEGRNREVRKLFDAVGMAVSRLIRIRYGSVVLPKGLRRSVWVDLDENDVRRLRQLAGADNTQRSGPQRDDGPREGAPREGAPRENAPRDGAPREGGQRNNNQPRNDRGPRGENGQRANNGGGQQQQPKQRDRGDRGDRNNRGRDRGARQDSTSSPAPFREPGDPAYIPNPLQQTFDRRAIQQRERPVIVDYDDESDGPIGPIPNPLQQTYDKRGVSGKASNPFAKGGKRGGGGGGGGGGQPKQPDPMQTAVGYIGADTFIKKLNNRGGGGGRGRR